MFDLLSALRSRKLIGGLQPQGGSSPTYPMRKRFFTGVDPTTAGSDYGGTPGDDGDPELGSVTDTPQAPAPQQSEAGNYFDEMQRVLRNRPATSAYQDALKTPPQEANYHPSLGRRLAGFGLGLAQGATSGDARQGMQLADTVINDPFKKQQSDYALSIGNKKAAAQIEGGDVDDQLKSLSEARAMGLKYDEFKLKQKEDNEKHLYDEADRKVKQQTADAATARANAYVKAQGKGDYEYKVQSDGSILAINKHDSNDQKTIPAKSIEAFTAQTGRMNANTGAKSAADRARDIDSLIATRAATGKRKTPASAGDQGKAIDTALSLLYRDARFKKFIKVGGDADKEPYVMAADDGSPMYRAFRDELKKKVTDALERGTPFGDSAGGDDEDIIDLTEKK